MCPAILLVSSLAIVWKAVNPVRGVFCTFRFRPLHKAMTRLEKNLEPFEWWRSDYFYLKIIDNYLQIKILINHSYLRIMVAVGLFSAVPRTVLPKLVSQTTRSLSVERTITFEVES